MNCSFPKCPREAKSTDLCRGHMQQKRRGGELRLLPDRKKSTCERFFEHVDTLGDCWLWTASRDSLGYGQMSVSGRPTRMHRLSYELHRGRIPRGLMIDHTCRNRACVNPEHLQAVTAQQNCQNRAVKTNSSSGYRGVYWDDRTNSYAVKVAHDGVTHWVGRFASLDDARAAVQRKRIQLHTNNLTDRAS